jgi:hypothetical protein
MKDGHMYLNIFFQNPTEAQRKEHDKYEFELHDVYAVDVLISTGKNSMNPSYT